MSGREDEKIVVEVRSYAASLHGAGGVHEGRARDAIAESVRRFARSGNEQQRLQTMIDRLLEKRAKIVERGQLLDDEVNELARKAAAEWLDEA